MAKSEGKRAAKRPGTPRLPDGAERGRGERMLPLVPAALVVVPEAVRRGLVEALRARGGGARIAEDAASARTIAIEDQDVVASIVIQATTIASTRSWGP